MKRLGLTVLFSVALSACVSVPHDGVRVTVPSRDYAFVDQILTGEDGAPREVYGELSFPDDADGPVPAVVLVHSSLGRDAQIWMYVERLNEMGFATLALDSFSARGITEIEYDQTAVTEASMITDAFAALNILTHDDRIDPDRIGIFGISKGAAPALFSSHERFASQLALSNERFAFHIAYYPWCGVRFMEPETTGAPILIVTGERDMITPASLCEDLIDDMHAYDPTVQAEIEVMPGARHAFDHPGLRFMPVVPLGFQVPHECFIAETTPGVFIEQNSDVEVTSDTFADVLNACSDSGFPAGGHRRAAAAAWERTAVALSRFVAPRGHVTLAAADQ